MINLTLPEWAFLDAHSHLGNHLEGRIVIYHVRSASVIEILDKDSIVLNSDAVKVNFTNTCTKEKLVAVLHYSTTLEGSKLIELLKACATWYCDYSEWEDKNILDNERKY